jgi:hypothetical protein
MQFGDEGEDDTIFFLVVIFFFVVRHINQALKARWRCFCELWGQVKFCPRKLKKICPFFIFIKPQQ